MGVVEHAEAELRRAGYLDGTAAQDYGTELAEAVLATLRTFYSYGHSEGSMQAALSLFNHLAAYGTLGPVTSDPDEWMEVTIEEGLWQNRRKSDVFSRDGGKTWYSLDDLASQARAEEEQYIATLDHEEVVRGAIALYESVGACPRGSPGLHVHEALVDDLARALGKPVEPPELRATADPS